MSAWCWYEATPMLRFVERDGKRILQQVWVKRCSLSGEAPRSSSEHYWEDVPMMNESAPTPAEFWDRPA
jgi:hypothetical protein